MRSRFLLLLVIVFAGYTLTAQRYENGKANLKELFGDRPEIYFQFTIPSPELLMKAGTMVSIDNIKGDNAFAYASVKEMEKFQQLGITFTKLPAPGITDENLLIKGPSEIKGTNTWNYYPTYEGFIQIMNDFHTTYPNLCSILEIGTTVQGRKLLVAKIHSNVNSGNPEFLYSGTMHGDETTGYVLLMHLIDYLLSNYGTNPKVTSLVDNLDIYIAPLANPDGTYHGGNSSVNGATRYNAHSIDLNRNYPDPVGGQHPDGNAWQPETQAFMNFADDHHIILSANTHGGAEVVNYPWDTWFKRHPDTDWWILVSKEYADSCQFYGKPGYMSDFGVGYTNGYDWYRAVGGRQDYMTYFQNGREFTLEISNTKLLPTNQLEDHWEYNYRSFMSYMYQATYGVRGVITDTITGAPVKAEVFVLNHDADSSWVYSYNDGRYFRPIKAGTWKFRFSANGYVTKTIDVTVNDYQALKLDVQLVPVGVWSFFDASKNHIEVNETINFSDESLGNPTNWSWTLTGGSPAASTIQNPSYIAYYNEGVYDVSLTASNSQYSNTNSKQAFIEVGNHWAAGNRTIEACSGWFYDNGGPDYPYATNKSEVTILKSATAGKQVELEFTEFQLTPQTSGTADKLRVFNGADTLSPIIGTYTAANIPTKVVSNNNQGTLTLAFSAGRTASQGWKATIKCSDSVGIDELISDAITIFPNPVNDQATIIGLPSNSIVSLYTIQGQLISQTIEKSGIARFNTAELKQGIYLVKIQFDGKTHCLKLVK